MIHQRPRKFLGYDWFKLIVAVILLLLLLTVGLRGCQPSTVVTQPTVVPVATAADAAPTALSSNGTVAITLPAGGSSVVAGQPLTISGTGAPGSTVEVLNGDTILGTATVGADGNWTLEANDLPEGAALLVVRPVGDDSAASAPIGVTVGGAATAPVITEPAAGASVAAGQPLTISGTGAPGSTVEVLNGDTVVGTATVGDDGAWTLDVTPEAGEAQYAARTQGSDTLSAPVGVVAEAAPAITAPAAGASVAAGQPLTISGTGTPGSTIEVLSGDTVVGTATVGDDGAWTLDVTPVAGEAQYVARTQGSTAASAPVAVAVTDGPVATPSGVLALTQPADGAQLAPGQQTFSGTAAPGLAVEVRNGDAVVATATAGADGNWTATGNLEAGTAALSVRPAGQDGDFPAIRVTIGDTAQQFCQTLAVNCNAWVQRAGGKRLRMRDGAGTSAGIITYLPIGTQMTLLEGPQQANDLPWWRVRTTGGQEGWVAGSELLLQPD